MSAFSKTTILSITTHGEIRLNSEIASAANIKYDNLGIANVLPTFVVNPRITGFYKFNAVAPGVLSYVSGDDGLIDADEIEKISRREGGYEAFDLIVGEEVAMVHRDIRDIIERTPGFDRINLGVLATEISRKVIEDIENILNKIKGWKADLKKKGMSSLTEDESDSFRFYTDFINNYDRSSNLVNCLEKSRKMINKSYVLLEDDLAPTGEDWAITSLNAPFNNRKGIFDEVYNKNKDQGVIRSSIRIKYRKSITLEQIVNYLAENGVERLIIIDMTCCPILGVFDEDPDTPDTEYTGRTIRMLRRGLVGNIPYGGKRSRRTIKRKTIKRKRRTIKRKRTRKYKK